MRPNLAHLPYFIIRIISAHSSFLVHGIPTILIIWVIIEHNLIKYTNGVIWIILSKGIPWCNSSLESRQKDLKVGMMRKGLPTSRNVLNPINHFSTLKKELID
jgi:hypothetical protein